MTALQDHNDWNASRSELFLIGSLTLLSLMAAFDATILIPTLPVWYGTLTYIETH